MAMALCPHFIACFMMSVTSLTASMSLIFVWQCSSTRFSTALSIRFTRKSFICMMPFTRPIEISWSKVSSDASPFIFMKAPAFTFSFISSACSFCKKSFVLIVSVKSVTVMIKRIFPFLNSLSSVQRT